MKITSLLKCFGLAGLLLLACSFSSLGMADETVPVGEWLDGYFFSVKVVDVSVAMELDGERPKEDRFVVVEIQWKANELKIKQVISGAEFLLVDDAGVYYYIAGMIFEPDSFDANHVNARFDRGGWIESKVTSNSDNTYRLVFDVPASAHGLKLWFRHLPLIDLALE